MQDTIAGGVILARPFERAASMNAALLPERFVTASGCLADIAPETWSIAWTSDRPDARQEAARRFGLDDARLRELTDWCTEALETGAMGWPGVLRDVDVAREVAARFFAQVDDLMVLGVALPADLAASFVEDTRPGPGMGLPGVVERITAGLPPDPRGRALGVEVLGWDHSGFHSSVCNGLETLFYTQLGITPNDRGLYTEEEARTAADLADDDATGSEPAIWLPWWLIEY